jgi:hypothetical protein
MEWATFEAVVDGLTAAREQGPGGEAPLAVAFMGLGEPLLHPRLLDMVRLAKRRGLRAEVTINALLLDDELAAGLLEAGLDQLVVSIDGASAEAGASTSRRAPIAAAIWPRPMKRTGSAIRTRRAATACGRAAWRAAPEPRRCEARGRGTRQLLAPSSRSSSSLALSIWVLNSMGRRICLRSLMPAPAAAVSTTMSP